VVRLRLVVPHELVSRVLARLEATPSLFALTHVPRAGRRPAGDLIVCDIGRADASILLDDLRALGLDGAGAMSIQDVESAFSADARAAGGAAAGSLAGAVVWEEVEERTSESAELSASFLAFMVLATLIAGAGILTDSLLPIIGAMVVGPDFGPLAGLCVAVVERRPELARRSVAALVVGFALAIMLMLAGAELARAAGKAPDDLTAATHPATIFIAEPNVYSAVVAVLAGIVGVLSLTTAKSGPLIGVLISVTTIPAAANVGVATAYGDWSEVRGALAQLGVNLAAIVVAGTATLALQRALYLRRRERHALGS
jgi:uncharacterized hydrophobic protein (TIGR00271 family)